jgi:serine/threonine protein kinase
MTDIVLYSRRDAVWKVADFGFTTQLRQSQSSILTQDGRGTEGYYPPEFLDDTADLRYSTKLDIWQLGCILFEFAVGRRAFSSNAATIRFQAGISPLEIPLAGDEFFGEECKRNISSCVLSILQIDERQRPTATKLVERFLDHHRLVERSTKSSQDNQTNIRHSFVPSFVTDHINASQHRNISPASTARTQLQTSSNPFLATAQRRFQASSISDQSSRLPTPPNHEVNDIFTSFFSSIRPIADEIDTAPTHLQTYPNPYLAAAQASLPSPVADQSNPSTLHWSGRISPTSTQFRTPQSPHIPSSQSSSLAEGSSTIRDGGTSSVTESAGLEYLNPYLLNNGAPATTPTVQPPRVPQSIEPLPSPLATLATLAEFVAQRPAQSSKPAAQLTQQPFPPLTRRKLRVMSKSPPFGPESL